MKSRSCDPCYAGSGRLTFGSPEPKRSFFHSKTNMAMLAAASGAFALLMAAKAGREVVAFENGKMCIALKEKESSDRKNRTEATKESEKMQARKPVLHDKDLACIFRGGFNQHIVHSAALLAVPYVADQPAITTSLLVVGIMLYCGTQYWKAFNRKPDCCNGGLVLGSTVLLGAWLSFLI